jgi:glycosyltransferase involved in cell wall biosynthesis
MRALLVAEDFPWPPTGGGLIRSAQLFEAVSRLGQADLFSLHDARRGELVVPEHVSISRTATAVHPPAATGRRWRMQWLAQRGTPIEVLLRSGDPAPRQAFESWAAEHYDVVWFSTPSVYAWLGRPRLGPTIVDLDNLEDVKTGQRLDVLRSDAPSEGRLGRLRSAVAGAQAAKNARDWKVFQTSVADEVARVVVCSAVDLRRAGLPNAVVVPNTYVRPARSLGRTEVGDPPVVLFQGRLNYAPNTDGATWLAEAVGPLLRARSPDARIRLVGKTTPVIDALHRPPSVTVVGSVPAMDPELAGADIAVVPLRIASGTRLKILESFAHRIPVVSTTLGAEGLDVADGVHLLLADDADAFAAACHRLLVDAALRARLADAAEDLYLRRYQWSTAEGAVERLVHDVIGVSTAP